MSLTEFEAELDKLTLEELRQLALKSWTGFTEKESDDTNFCSEDDAELLNALDNAIEQADATPRNGYSATEVRSRLAQWSSK